MTNREAIDELMSELTAINPNDLGREEMFKYATALDMGINALKVVETINTLVEQGKVSSVTIDQLKQLLNEYMGGDENEN